MSRKNKISFCIVCMNRLYQLKETLLKNILDNQNYNELEFVVLDYNSNDGMEEWIRKNMQVQISSGKLIYYKTFQPERFNHSHSKNLAFMLATGDILCSINADHYTGKGFAEFVNNRFTENDNIVLTTIDFNRTENAFFPSRDLYGKVCVKKDRFVQVTGFDESMTGYGFEDWDLINRLELLNVKREFIKDESFLEFIAHNDDERYTIEIEQVESIYVKHLNPSRSELIFFFKTKNYKRGVIIDNTTDNSDNYIYSYRCREYDFEYDLMDLVWETGSWKEHKGVELSICPTNGLTYVLEICELVGNVVLKQGPEDVFYKILDKTMITDLMKFNYFLNNRAVLQLNLKNKKTVANGNGFGKAVVFKNFCLTKPLSI